MSPIVYPDHLKIKDALQLYFSHYHFENGGYDKKWFRIQVGPFFIPLPNIKSRVDAVKIHDIHHLVTGYAATLKGEAEIGAWEIGSGCGKYYVAWLLNFGSFFYGLFFFTGSLFRAFIRGRKCKTNLYYGIPYNEALLAQTVGDVKTYTGVDLIRKTTAIDVFYFLFYCLMILAEYCLFFFLAYLGFKLMLLVL